MKRILFLTNKDSGLHILAKAGSELASAYELELTCIYTAGSSLEEIYTAVSYNELIIFFLTGGMEHYPLYGAVRGKAAELQKKFIPVCSPGETTLEYLQTATVEKTIVERVQKYFHYGSKENYRQLLLYLSELIGGEKTNWQEPVSVAWQGLYHPGLAAADLDEYLHLTAYDPAKPTLGLYFSRHEWVQDNLYKVDALIAEGRRQGANVIAVFGYSAKDAALGSLGIEAVFDQYFYRQGKRLIDVLLVSAAFALTASAGLSDKQFLKKLNVPVLQGITSFSPYAEWDKEMMGLNAVDTAVSVALPEFDGALITVPLATKEKRDDLVWYEPIEERIGKYISLALKWAELGRKPNAEKRVAVIFHNYPPRNDRIGNAVGLDTMATVCSLLAALKDRGYKVDCLPENGQELVNALLQRVTNDRRYLTDEQIKNAAGRVDKDQYLTWFNSFAQSMQESLRKDWGEAPGKVFCLGEELLIPGLLNGNIFLGLQPPRGFGEEKSKIYHSPDLAPPHHYLAYYRWIRDVFRADAVIHVGKHGSLEWLPGKGAGLSKSCYPDAAIADLPNIYPYIINDPGEGTQAKRRSFACIIDHLPPCMTLAGLTDELLELERLLQEYREAKQLQREKLPVILKLLREKTEKAELQTDLQLTDWSQPENNLEKLSAYLEEIHFTPIRQGLHILGQLPRFERLRDFYFILLRLPNGEIPSLMESLAAVMQVKAESDEVWNKGIDIISLIMEADYALPIIEEITEDLENTYGSNPCLDDLRSCLVYLVKRLAPDILAVDQEMEACLAALNGEFILPGPSGAPTRGMADILPTGRNFYSLDPRSVPTKAAWQVGQDLASQLTERFLNEEGHYPESIGLVLWATPVMRNKGDDMAEIMALLGVRPVWAESSGWVVDLEVIPLAELGRPRIDVTVRISGLYRDTFPQGVEWLDRAVEMVAALDEPEDMNYVRKHVLADTQKFLEEGDDLTAAAAKAGYRIFGCMPGSYGAGVGKLLEEGNWENIDQMRDVYLTWGGFAYGQKGYGVSCREVFAHRLGQVEATVKNEDNRELNILDGDDYNAYHGGMIAAVHSLRGKAPSSYCGDTSKPQAVKTRSLKEEMKLIFRSQVLNPKWLDSMQEHGYKAAGDLASLVSHCFEWDATSEVLDDWMYERLAETYALNPQMQEWMNEVNPWALQTISRKLLEAIQREMWQAKEETKKELQKLYLSIESELEGRME